MSKEETIKDPVFNISKEDQKYIKRICDNNIISLDEKVTMVSELLNQPEDKIRDILNFLGISLTDSQFAAAKLHTLKEKKRYIISSAQTASPVNLKFLHNVEKYAKFINAEIGIIATRYKNPTSLFKEDGDVWDVLVHPYLTANRQFLHKNVLLLADLKILATSPNPTSGVELFGDGASCIVGSPRIEMRPIAVLPGVEKKFVYSTGSVTIPSFTDSVAGGKASEHHSYGFIIVEIENDDIVHIRNVSADSDGNFNDLIYRVEDQRISKERVDTLVWGDSHFAKKRIDVTKAFRKLCSDLGIKKSVLHDVFDSESMNVHNLKDPIVKHQLMMEGRDDLSVELFGMFSELEWFEKNMKETIVVASNHDDMLDRAMTQNDWRDNIKNAKLFVELLGLKLSGQANNGLIPFYINKKFKKIKALGLNDSYIRNGVELALHGHKGPNGSRGTINAFSKLSCKSIIGHNHCPAIMGGCYQVGISCKEDHVYNKGLSGWAFSGCTLNKYGKRQMIVFNKDTLTYTTLY